MTLPVVFTANGPSGYNLTKSLRFRSSASAYLNRTPASNGSGTTFTWSGWVKRGILGGGNYMVMYSAGSGDAAIGALYFGTDNKLNFLNYNGAVNWQLISTAVYRDPSAWYHIVAVVDTTQATSSNRIKLYVNGVQVTAFDTASYPSQNYASPFFNQTGYVQFTGRWGTWNASHIYDGYLSENNFVDGQALTPSSFGSTNALTGVWQPAKYTGTYGTNGFYLPFTNTTSTTTLGYDLSGNSNNWTTNNLSLTAGSTYDSMTDVPTLTSATTANYCVFNPISSGGTITNGNLSTSNNDTTTYGTVAITTGKFYWEYTITACSGGASIALGVSKDTNRATGGAWGANDVFLYQSGGNKYGNGTSGAYGATYTTGDVIGVALDMTGYTLTFYKNNVSQGTAFSSTQISPYILIPMFYGYPSGNSANVNFGQQPFAYTPPTGYLALNTYNLPTSTIQNGAKNFDINLYTGTSLSQSITNAQAFQPSFVWLKSRSNATDHVVHDVLRGTAGIARLFPNLTNAESATGDGFLSINSNGFSLDSSGGGGDVNTSGRTYVAWQWAGPSSGTSNTSGSITSTVSVNATAGFSVVTYTGSGAAGTVGHGLGVAPAMIITKKRTNAGGGSANTSWVVWQKEMSGAYSSTTAYAYMNSSSAASTTTVFYDGTAMTSSTFRWQTGNDNTNYANDTFVSYCWSEIAGFSKFGSYTGNGSADGPFVYTGFRPKYIMMKSTSVESWEIFDTSRSPYNQAVALLEADSSGAENNSSTSAIDILSNGFKQRNTRAATNGSGTTYIYMAFAENPFKNALAR